MFPAEGSLGIFQPIIGSWYESLKSPHEFQRRVLLDLIKEYEKTRYGKNYHASEIEKVADFRINFPVIDYGGLNPYLAEIKKGNYAAILPEPLVCWVMTRGSTGP
ncbi:GH3 auxin-responsive promoter family protein, partial [Candidatus Bathyarchaeota archaeon]|nr:GH3 auxin-responsive promoter family protein [Candidatus Bathyarchaeota archaeon]